MFGDKDGRLRGVTPSDRTVAEKKGRVLRLLASYGGHVTRVVAETKVARSTLARWRDDDPEFASAWDFTIERAVEDLEAEVRRRAMGYEEELVYQGRKTGQTVTKYSDTLLMFLLKGHKPEKYRDGPLAGKVGEMADEELDKRIADYMKRKDKQAPVMVTDANN